MNRLKAFGVGASTITDWLGDGGVPVDPVLAEHRAQHCVEYKDGQPCPFNQPGNWWDRFSSEVAVRFMAQRRALFAMGLRIPSEEKLHFCQACHCPLETKVFVPMKHIAEKTPDSLWGELPPWCWMLKELPKP